MKNTLAFLGLFLTLSSLNAQIKPATDPNTNLWVSHLGDHKISDKWSIHSEIHIRRSELGLGMQQLLIRPAVNYNISDAIIATVGYSFYSTYRYGDIPVKYNTPEHHSFEQIHIGQSSGRWKFSGRFRLEQRFIAGFDNNGNIVKWNYLNRARTRLMVTVPLNKPKIAKGVVFASAYDEMFVNFSDPTRSPWVHQNRVSVLIGYQIKTNMSIQLGYLFQNIFRPNIPLNEENSTIHMIWTWNLDLRKKDK